MHDWELVHKLVSNEEIKAMLFSMGGLKAPGSNGLHALFLQSRWEVVGKSVCDLVSLIFHNPVEVGRIKQTFISLIPKVEHPETVKQFHPISLCNVIYVTSLISCCAKLPQ